MNIFFSLFSYYSYILVILQDKICSLFEVKTLDGLQNKVFNKKKV
jgi:hypothetical protein